MKSMLLTTKTWGSVPAIWPSPTRKGSPLPTADTDETVTKAMAMPATYVRIWRFMSMLLFRSCWRGERGQAASNDHELLTAEDPLVVLPLSPDNAPN